MNPIRCLVPAALVLLAACAAGPRPEPASTTHSGTVAPEQPAQTTVPPPPAPPPPPPPPPPPAPPTPPPPPPPAEVAPPPAAPPAAVKPKAPAAPVARAKPTPPAAPVPPAKEASGPVAISGWLELVAASGQTLSPADMANAVVYFTPAAGGARAQPGRFTIYTHNKQFEPESLVVPVGSTISFPNQDEILHNVFSVTPASSFDLGLYGEGKSAQYVFRKPGLVLINCNVHHAMQANVLVVETPYVARVDASGRFELAGLPAGPGTLTVWHPRAAAQTQALDLPLDAALNLKLALTKPRVIEHLNKERKAYAPGR